MTWLDELDAALADARIPRGRRRRIVAELDDHLRCEPGSAARLGAPAALARRFADELGTALARRAAFATFAALVPVGLLFAAVFVLSGRGALARSGPPAAFAALVVGVQVAFVGGTLALLRAWRLRRSLAVSAGDRSILLRRAALGLAGGLVTIAAVAVVSGSALAYATVAVGGVTLAAASALAVAALRLRPAAEGAATGDLASDLGLGGRSSWRLALAISGALALAIAVAGVVASDPFDGALRGLADGSLCLAGFAALGRPLGLRA